jgi:hypothetical protein
MLYIVSGFMRTGTSMMMRALEAGGMDAAYSAERDARMNAHFGEPDYRPNDKYYELEWSDYRRGDLGERYAGRLIKCLYGGMLRMPPTDCRVVFMRRPANEIRSSLIAFFGDAHAAKDPDLDRMLELTLAVLRDRKSFRSVHDFWYADVVANPYAAFAQLAKDGWPINARKAAKIPNAAQVRFANA